MTIKSVIIQVKILRKEGGKKMMAIEKDTFGERLRKLRVFGKLKGSSVITTQKHASLS